MLYIPETTLVGMLFEQIAAVKCDHPEWGHPYRLARSLGIRLAFAGLGTEREGAALDDVIVVNPTTSGAARHRFTVYHEIVHHLVRRNDELLSLLSDQYRTDEDFDRICERLSNIGAAEFLVPRAVVQDTVQASGFSLVSVLALARSTDASFTAICVQLVSHAAHRCLTTVCTLSMPQRARDAGNGELFARASAPNPILRVETAACSASMRYPVVRGSIIPAGHLMHDALLAEAGEIVRGEAAIPFRNSRTKWEVESEAIRVGERVYAIFHVDRPPTINRDQLRLF